MDNLINPSSIPVVTDEGENYYEPRKPRVQNPRHTDRGYPVISLTDNSLEQWYFNFYEYSFRTYSSELVNKIKKLAEEYKREKNQPIQVQESRDKEVSFFFNYDFIEWVNKNGKLKEFDLKPLKRFVAKAFSSNGSSAAESMRFTKLLVYEAQSNVAWPDNLQGRDANWFRKVAMDMSTQIDSFLSEEGGRFKLQSRIRIHEFAHHEVTEIMFGSLKREVGELVSSLLNNVADSDLEEFYSLDVEMQNKFRQLEFLQETLEGLEESFAMTQDLFAPGESAGDQKLVKTLLNIHCSSIFANFRNTAQSRDVPFVDLSRLINGQHEDIVLDPHFVGIAIILSSGIFLTHDNQRIFKHPEGTNFTNLTLFETLELFVRDPEGFLKRINPSRLLLLIEVKIFDTLCLQLETIKELVLSSQKSQTKKNPDLVYSVRKLIGSISKNHIVELLKSFSKETIEILVAMAGKYGVRIENARKLLQFK